MYLSIRPLTVLSRAAVGLALAAALALPATAQISLNPNPAIVECPGPFDVLSGVTLAPGFVLTGVSGTLDTRTPGTYTLTYTASNGVITVSATRQVIVRDTTPPVVTATVAQRMLWPPNHDLINVGLSAVVTDTCDPHPKVIGVTVYGNEDDEEQTGDGHHSPDAKNIGIGTLRLRSERKGDGGGRVYLIVVAAQDASGNIGYGCTTVVVPHDRSKRSIAAANQLAVLAALYGCPFGSPVTPYVIGDGPVLGPKQ